MLRVKDIRPEFKHTEDLLRHVLTKYPETRNSDNALYIQCCKELGAKTLDDVLKLDLNIQSVGRMRRFIQNDCKELLPTKEIRQARKVREEQAIEHFRA